MQGIMINVDNLRGLIGHEVHYDGKRCQIIEVLEDGPAVILQHHNDSLTTIQPDQHGEAHRKVPATITIPVLDQEGLNINPEFHALDLAKLV